MLGASIGKPSADEDKPGTTSCVYPPGDAGSYSQAEVTIEWDHGDAPSFERLLVNAFGGSAVGRQVAHNVHLGDEASYSREGVLSARTGKTLVTITLPMRPDSEEKALAIGKRLLGRLGVPRTGRQRRVATPRFRWRGYATGQLSDGARRGHQRRRRRRRFRTDCRSARSVLKRTATRQTASPRSSR